ncbi:MAG TPA: hypothetical protein VGS07_02055 [Thermoanaerobaculia bacterium]|jgi:hypothetical protein|nr:hypothetical protein [Thermoanaerobaculia bacterium]
MTQRIVRRLMAAGAVAAVLATGPLQAQGGPQETRTLWHWLGSFQEQAVRVLHLWLGGAVQEKQGLMIDPDGNNASGPGGPTAPSCQGSCTDQGPMIDPNG